MSHLVAQWFKNPLAMQEMWVSILTWEIPWTREPGRPQSKELDMIEQLEHAHM